MCMCMWKRETDRVCPWLCACNVINAIDSVESQSQEWHLPILKLETCQSCKVMVFTPYTHAHVCMHIHTVFKKLQGWHTLLHHDFVLFAIKYELWKDCLWCILEILTTSPPHPPTVRYYYNQILSIQVAGMMSGATIVYLCVMDGISTCKCHHSHNLLHHQSALQMLRYLGCWTASWGLRYTPAYQHIAADLVQIVPS